jgi:phosphopantothenoylcysteine decarboxylase/phosphopantothenate--cysteine ligase
MRCLVTAGPTFEPLDAVRRLTNFSTGRLGTELAHFLSAQGHDTTLLIGQHATYAGERQVRHVETFSTTENLRAHLQARVGHPIEAVFHAAAVSDFSFGKLWRRSSQGELTELRAGKVTTRQGALLAELLPTPKIIAEMRQWFPNARLVGWKYEVDGDRAGVVRLAEKQIADYRTDACVANGPAYGPGFGLIRGGSQAVHLAGAPALFEALEKFIREWAG